MLETKCRNLPPEKTKKADELRMNLRSNLAAVCLKLKLYHEAVDHCNNVLKEDSKHLKVKKKIFSVFFNNEIKKINSVYIEEDKHIFI